jgi:hypothetical protein
LQRYTIQRLNGENLDAAQHRYTHHTSLKQQVKPLSSR